MLALKSLVVGLGLLIVVAMTVIGYGLMKKAEDPDFTFFRSDGAPAATAPAADSIPVAASGPLAPFGDVVLGLPEGCAIADARMLADRRMLLRVSGPGACARAVVVDLAAGRVLGHVRAR